jgi:DNA polymerase-3 subunit epsilon
MGNHFSVIVADTETGGLDPRKHPILTLSAIRCSDGANFNVKIAPEPGMVVEEDALAVTGLDLTDIRVNGISERQAAEEFSRFVQGDHILAGCNFPFDQGFISAMYRRQKMDNPISHRCVDLQTAAFLAHEHGTINLPVRYGVPLMNLDAVSESFGLARAGHLHDSLEDVILTQQCIEASINSLKGRSAPAESKTNLIFVDIETSGLNPDKHAILRLSATRSTDGQTFDRWVKPEEGKWGDKKSLERNKIDIQFLKENGDDLRDVLKDFSKFAAKGGPSLMAGCGVAFELSFLDESCRRHGVRPPFSGKRIDLQSAAFIAHECGWISLDPGHKDGALSFGAIAKACGFERKEGADRSPSDMELAIKCLEKCGKVSYKQALQRDAGDGLSQGSLELGARLSSEGKKRDDRNI